MNKQRFFEKFEGEAFTYDDVRLVTAPSDVAPTEVDIQSRFSRHTEVKIPMVSAAMDTVTEADMAIAMAKMGGLGVIHAGMSVNEQRNEVRKVKLHLNGLIEKPITVEPDQTLASVLEYCERKDFDFRTFPVVDENRKLIGILTGRDFSYSEDKNNDTVGDSMTPIGKVLTAESNLKVEDAYTLMKNKKLKILPLTNNEGRVAGMYVSSDVLRIVRGNPDQYNLDSNGRLIVAAAVPTDPEEAIERIKAMRPYLDVAVLDTAQGDSKYAFKTLRAIKETFADLDLVVGNISTGDSALKLAQAGADGIKVGQGPGSICTTRTETGIGTPQVSAVYQCVQALKKDKAFKNIPICADGGITNPGDISIAIAAGAHTVMMGSKLAGTDEAPGKIERLSDGSTVKLYRGMGSPSALRDSAASRKRYGTGNVGKPLAEGVESYVSYKGSVTEPLDHYTKALRKSMSYCGAVSIKMHQKRTKFNKITPAGMRESHPHDVRVI